MIQNFLAMIRNNPPELQDKNKRRIFVAPVFEISKEKILPDTKGQLLNLLDEGSVIIFHKTFCRSCHEIPGFHSWIADEENGENMPTTSMYFKSINRR